MQTDFLYVKEIYVWDEFYTYTYFLFVWDELHLIKKQNDKFILHGANPHFHNFWGKLCVRKKFRATLQYNNKISAMKVLLEES